MLLLCVCAGYSRHPWRDPGPVVVTSEPGEEPSSPAQCTAAHPVSVVLTRSGVSRALCRTTNGAVLPHSSISLAAPACRLRPQTVARSSAACVQTACVCPPHLHHRQPRMRDHIVCQDVFASSSGRAGKILPAGVSLNIYSKMLQCWTPPSLHGAIQFSTFVSVSFSV